jgi:hypothetical protein
MEELRAAFGPQMWVHLEQLVMRSPNAKERLAKMREMSKNMAARRAASAAPRTHSDEQPTQTASGATSK